MTAQLSVGSRVRVNRSEIMAHHGAKATVERIWLDSEGRASVAQIRVDAGTSVRYDVEDLTAIEQEPRVVQKSSWQDPEDFCDADD